jgi:hypothetical protein
MLGANCRRGVSVRGLAVDDGPTFGPLLAPKLAAGMQENI